ncbi:BEL1-like homeodomain protein 3 [Olea europaea subsp. europaea]|uniref:BEL1-like homeodomain protein 3 n=1 Tax=Olea europaea subsp. europaea TaxID=158383 RepID=A0A8S0S9Q0_OLEEU|nr:BEL1-like homeodomain protein 3 [Olea europaea subsp. europaea]
MKSAKETDGELGNGTSDAFAAGISSMPQESTSIFPSGKHDMQEKNTKLLSILDKMHIVVSSFDAIAGSGAAKTYTALALKTIYCHFRSLYDAINGQIRMALKKPWGGIFFGKCYPKDLDRTMLGRQTGLTRSQVSNWFINARVRLWKPMVEEMYEKEVGDV